LLLIGDISVESNGLYVRFSKGPSVPGPFFVFKDEWRGQ